jgi:NodT family efflux transporter outer membrane factor (OMF) lipoprotein
MRKRSLCTHPLTLLCASLPLAGCATPDVAPATASLLSPQQLGAQPAASQPAANWWAAINDPVLDKLVSLTLSRSPRLTLADARLRAARASSDSVASSDGLRVNGSASFVRERSSEYGNNPPAYRGIYTNLETVGLDASYRFDFWGKTRAQLAAARGQARAAALEADDARQWLAWAVSSQYLEWRTAQAALQLLRDDQAQADALLQNSQVRSKHGLAAPEELAQLQAQQAESQERLARASQREAQARHALAALSAQPQSDIDQLPAGKLPQWQLDTRPYSTATLGLRADIQAARERVEAANAGVRAARADFYPDLRIGGLAALSSAELSNLLDPGARLLRFAPALTLPIFSNGELNARLSGRTADYEQAVALYNQTLLAAIQDTADRASLLQSLVQAENQVQAAQHARYEAARVLQVRLNSGLVSRSQWLAENRRYTQARLATLETQAQRLQAQAALLRALGSAPTAG